MHHALVFALALAPGETAFAYDASLLTQPSYEVASQVVAIPVTNLATVPCRRALCDARAQRAVRPGGDRRGARPGAS